MSYSIENQETIENAIQRIAGEQIDNAIAELGDQELDQHEKIHQVRKRCKKIRGLVRLVRPQFEETYQYENAWYRDAAKELAPLRDAQSMVEIYNKLTSWYEYLNDFAPIGKFLLDRRDQIAQDRTGIQNRLDSFYRKMEEGKARTSTWSFEGEDFEAVAGGISKTYKRGRKAFSLAYQNPGSERFHEWRKRVKYHWYHSRLLTNIWPDLMDEYNQQIHLLADYLGDLHDLALLSKLLSQHSNELDQEQGLQVISAQIEQERTRLRATARPLGERIYCEKPKRLVKRFRCYWEAWQTAEDSD